MAFTITGGISISSGFVLSDTPGLPTYGSAYFSNSSYLLTGTALTLGTTCTFECWFRTTLNPATSKFVLLGGSGNRGLNVYNGAYGSGNYSATTINVDWETAGNFLFTVPTMSANTWYHLAVAFNAGTATVWLNGTRSSTGTVATGFTFGSQTYRIGAWTTQSTYSQNVYISNPRITKSAVYDITQTSITVPTAPLTAIANTQLLLNTANNSSFLNDSSTNNMTITNNGGVVSSPLSPFA
jgi:Concanavalin A-like lectin/glucanases superfamily